MAFLSLHKTFITDRGRPYTETPFVIPPVVLKSSQPIGDDPIPIPHLWSSQSIGHDPNLCIALNLTNSLPPASKTGLSLGLCFAADSLVICAGQSTGSLTNDKTCSFHEPKLGVVLTLHALSADERAKIDQVNFKWLQKPENLWKFCPSKSFMNQTKKKSTALFSKCPAGDSEDRQWLQVGSSYGYGWVWWAKETDGFSIRNAADGRETDDFSGRREWDALVPG